LRRHVLWHSGDDTPGLDHVSALRAEIIHPGHLDLELIHEKMIVENEPALFGVGNLLVPFPVASRAAQKTTTDEC
jgi:hypothetical protein